MPPVTCVVRVTDCPLSIAGEDGVMAPATRAGLTLTVSPKEQAVDGVKAESVTLYE